MSIILFLLLTLPPVPPDYKLQIGDEIVITVSGNINFSYSQILSPQGIIFIQSGSVQLFSPESSKIVPTEATVLGTVKVVGLTLEEAKGLVEQKLKRYFKNITVSLSITKFQDVVYVEGGVTIPGAYPFFPGKAARDYIGLAGGPLPSGDIENIKITTPDNEVIDGSLEVSPPRNSVITVPHAFVYVKGEVTQPGSFPYHPGTDAHQYIGMAGGSTDRADLKRSYVLKKDGKKVPLNIGGKSLPTIEKGDIIVVKRVFLKWWEDYITIIGSIVSSIYLFTLIKSTLQK